ncbi:LOW QUALITY PROTEIN: probable LRR receptor-like serine/threonine-protein kinase At5g48740 [Phalaenopsis equestris]|uniref:LOW QUALITY PROTEIN: probable LRR receptor-like serine/threonine-protein kinase At5g48740 n=1 Tax=Phalaenopsis equestris TaxID=78828 RepID=UPI0009E2741F|nr:LOW QUALITY PROTEIN: probable LRR receptor-like serine/threonine-protein kinase At5g48740 [Phalaenopsis equestris]
MAFPSLILLFSSLIPFTSPEPLPGFLSLSCGASTPFTDSFNISWVPDSPYINLGRSVPSLPLRFFAESHPARNCYRLAVGNFSLVLIRASFAYNNYDGKGLPPSFAVSLGTTMSAVVNLSRADPWAEEFVWKVVGETLLFCLISMPGAGFPVISSLEVRLLPAGAYGASSKELRDTVLRKRYRINCGYQHKSPLRYPFDYYDRIWDEDQKFHPSRLSGAFYMPLPLKISGLKENPPLVVLQTARVLARRNVLNYRFPLEKLGNYYLVIYFAGVMPVSSSFDVLVNGDVVSSDYHVRHAEVSSVVYLAKNIERLKLSFRNVSFYPQVNGIEIYEVLNIPPECPATTVSALQVIQQSTGFDLGWEDDPCSPTAWSHIGCNGSLVTSLELSDVDLRVISPTFGDLLNLKKLDLHNTSLTGEIMNLGSLQELEVLNLSFNMLTSFGSEFGTMINLQILDLENNSLKGPIPDSLGTLKDLHLLNLENNKLQGVLPQSLNKKNLEIRTSGNLCLAFSASSCDRPKNHTSLETPQFTVINMKKRSVHTHKTIIISVVGCFCCVLFLVTIVLFISWKKRWRKNELISKPGTTREIKKWCTAHIFTYKEIKAATNNFKDVIGTGGFGSVYRGKFSDGKQVAVKVRLDKTQLGADSFINEVHLLSQIRHQNLVSLEGFCHESKQQILVYEYLPSGSLADNLYGSNSKNVTLNWARRLKIAMDAAKGLEYLHNGSNPRIIHRDIKCSNILLDLDMNAKVADFGLSRQISQTDITHITTAVKGTEGYLDPEYFATQQLTEKSDVYSFGVVLLELICGREPLSHAGAPNAYNLVLWVFPSPSFSSHKIHKLISIFRYIMQYQKCFRAFFYRASQNFSTSLQP